MVEYSKNGVVREALKREVLYWTIPCLLQVCPIFPPGVKQQTKLEVLGLRNAGNCTISQALFC